MPVDVWRCLIECVCTCFVGMDAWPRWAAYTGSSAANLITLSVSGRSALAAHMSRDAELSILHIAMRCLDAARTVDSDVPELQ